MAPLVPMLPQIGKQEEVADEFDESPALKFAFIGVGQGGGRIAEAFYKLGYRRVAAVNTAGSDLEDLDPGMTKLDLGFNGAGQDIMRGQECVNSRLEDIRDLMVRTMGEPDYLFVCASLGGGTGSGGVNPVVRAAKQYMVDKTGAERGVGAIVSLPSRYEGSRTCNNAVRAFDGLMKESPSPLLLIDNQRLESLFKGVGALNLFNRCNEQVAGLLHLFNQLANRRSQLITFDGADFRALLDSGLIAMGVSQIEKFQSAADLTESVRGQLAQTVQAEVDLKGGKAAGCVFLGGEKLLDQIPMAWFGEAFSMLQRQLAEESAIYRGVYVSTEESLRAYTLFGALPPPVSRVKGLISEGRVQDKLGDWFKL